MLYIRTDMNETVATGHMMRCLAIADAAREAGEDTLFIVADEQAAGLLEEKGYSYCVLGTKWDDMESELPVLKKLIEERRIQRILIDSYQVTANYLKQLTAVTKTAYMDDLNAFFYPVDTLICYENYWEQFNYPVRYPDTKLYLGPEYVPLRRGFSNCGRKNIRQKPGNLLLMSGGADQYGILKRILEKLDRKAFQRIDVICGRYNQFYDELKIRYEPEPAVKIHTVVDNIERYMQEADLAVSAGGVTVYELCAVGTPAISYTVADNQMGTAEKFSRDGIIDYAGDIRSGDMIGRLLCLIDAYCKDFALRRERSGKMQEIVDGNGAARIADVLKSI